MRYYLAPYVGTGTGDDPYRPAGTDLDAEAYSLDLRRPGETDGFGLMWQPDPISNAASVGAVDLGDDPSGSLGVSTRNQIGSRLSLTVDAANFGDAVAELLLNHARTDGTRWKPLQFSSRRRRDPDDGSLTSRYRGIYLGPAGERIWEQHVRDGPGTTITESFNTGDSDTLGPDLTWTESIGDIDIISNVAAVQPDNVYSYARAESELATADMFVKATMIETGNEVGVFARQASGTDTGYGAIYHTNQSRLRRFDGGSQTNLSSDSHTKNNGDTWRVEVDGSDIEMYINDTLEESATDTNLTGPNFGGIAGFKFSGTDPQLDDWSASDLTIPGGIIIQNV